MKKILVVDDDSVIQKVLSTILRKAGYHVDCASGGQEALDYVSRETPDCILLDLYMDDKSGLDVLVEIRDQFSKESCPIIMISSEEDATSVGVALDFGANDYLVKPVSADVLRAKLSELLATGAPTLPPGHCLGPYKIDRLLRQSGDHAIYQVTDERLLRQLSIKVSPAAEYEATALARVNHRNVLILHDLIFEPFPHLVTELVNDSVEGCSPGLSEAVRWTREILRGAGALHAQGLVHTSINPTTVTVTPEGRICLTDLARPMPSEACR